MDKEDREFACWVVGGVTIILSFLVCGIGHYVTKVAAIEAGMWIEIAAVKAEAWVGVAREIGEGIASLGG